MSRPIQPSGIASAATTCVAASAANASAMMTSTGSTRLDAGRGGLVDEALDRVDLVGLEQRRADAVALRGEERVRHSPPISSRSTRVIGLPITPRSTVADLRAAEDDDERACRLDHDAAEDGRLLVHEAARGVAQPRRASVTDAWWCTTPKPSDT